MYSALKKIAIYAFLVLFLANCQSTTPLPPIDLILYNGSIYTVDSSRTTVQAIAISKDRIYQLGDNDKILALKEEQTKLIDLHGQFAMPGFIEGHGHFSSLGRSLQNLNFLHAKNWDEITKEVAEEVKTAKPGEWIIGSGWHQEKWDKTPENATYGYPFHRSISEISPNNPVLLWHASGHGLFANALAMEKAGISVETPNPAGGNIVRNSNGAAIGVFEETAMTPIYNAYQSYLETVSKEDQEKKWQAGIRLAQDKCLEKGITTFDDAGSSYSEIERYQKLAEQGKLDIRLWVMLRHSYDEMKEHMAGFPILNKGNHFFTCRAIKTEIDGALGSYGAWLLEPYQDKPGFSGQNTTPLSEIENIAQLALDHNMQCCVHAIGDKGNRVILDFYEKFFKQKPSKTARRWRIEHAQHLDLKDIPRFAKLGVIPVMQGIHCTSDAPFVEKRLGYERAKTGAYAWHALLESGAIIANGTDAPVEEVDPIPCLYASVTRKRTDTGLEFFPEQAMTREQAIYSYTYAPAYATFEEKDKGSLEKGKLADIVVLSQNLLTCTDEEILNTAIRMTIVGGEVKYERGN